MPSVPLPPIPEDVAAKPEYATEEEGPHPDDDDYDDIVDDDYDSDAEPAGEFRRSTAASDGQMPARWSPRPRVDAGIVGGRSASPCWC